MVMMKNSKKYKFFEKCDTLMTSNKKQYSKHCLTLKKIGTYFHIIVQIFHFITFEITDDTKR